MFMINAFGYIFYYCWVYLENAVSPSIVDKNK